MEVAKGGYIAFVDADDYVEEDSMTNSIVRQAHLNRMLVSVE